MDALISIVRAPVMIAADTPDPDRSSIARPLGDPLVEILHLLKLTGTFYCQARLSAPWGIEVPAFDGVLSLVMVTQGRCWLTLGAQASVCVDQGSLVLLTGGAAHSLRSAPDVGTRGLDTLPVNKITEIYETLDYGGGGETTHVMYGVVRIDHAAGAFMISQLPDLLRVDTWSEDAGSWLQATLQFIAREARDLRPGGETVITRLADVVVIEAIRRWIAAAPEANSGWLKAARDPQIGRAIMAIHRAPATDWTVGRLAAAAGMSRSSFCARFSALIGVPAMQYVTLWRMHLARAALQDTTKPLAQIAAEFGYQSEPAFCRTYKRIFRETPGTVRRRRAG